MNLETEVVRLVFCMCAYFTMCVYVYVRPRLVFFLLCKNIVRMCVRILLSKKLVYTQRPAPPSWKVGRYPSRPGYSCRRFTA